MTAAELKLAIGGFAPALAREMRQKKLVYYLVVADPDTGLVATASNLRPSRVRQLLEYLVPVVDAPDEQQTILNEEDN